MSRSNKLNSCIFCLSNWLSVCVCVSVQLLILFYGGTSSSQEACLLGQQSYGSSLSG